MIFYRLRDLRADRDLSQVQVAQLLNVKQTTYSGYETGSHSVPITALIQLADFYNTSIDYLVERTDNPAPPHK